MLELPAQHVAQVEPPPVAENTAPVSLIYQPLTSLEKWRVEKFDLLSAEFQFIPPWNVSAAQFHSLAETSSRGWLISRRLFGISPLIPKADSHPDDLRPWTREEICAALGIEDKAQLTAELDALRVLWKNHSDSSPKAEEKPAPANPDAEPEFKFSDELLEQYGFNPKMFELEPDDTKTGTARRSTEDNRKERDWFARRVNEWRKMLDEPMSSALAREALLNELYLKRIGAEMSVYSPTSAKFKNLKEAKLEFENSFKEQRAELQDMFPELNVAGKVSFHAVIADLIRGVRDYVGNNDNRLIDKVRTAGELEVELRASQQNPEPRYRFGLNVAIVEAIHHLYDPNYRSQFKHSDLAKLDHGFREGVRWLREKTGEVLVDLENGVMPGEGDEFPDVGRLEDVAA